MVKDIRVRPEGGISEPSLDIYPNWNDMRSEFVYYVMCNLALTDSLLREKRK